MSRYYEYQDVKVMIAHKLMNLEGWTVYGYKADESDSMTDYYSPAYWNGVAEKNGYILCVNVYGASEGEDIKKYTNANAVDRSIYDKISKLEEMTVERGATEAEQATAQKRIGVLKTKLSEQEEQAKEYIVTGHIPGHMANPPRMNWHIEKDGKYIAKGNGILKYSAVHSYYTYGSYSESMKNFKENPQKWLEDLTEDLISREAYNTKERCEEVAQYRFDEMQKDAKLVDQFESFVNKLDVTCGGMIGNGEQETYKTVTVTEYKKETKAKETASGEVAEGQCFIVKSSYFNQGICRGYVYRIHADQYPDGATYYKAYKLNGKLTKECHGMATAANSWFIGEKDGISYNKFMKWINDGALQWCELEEVKTPYEVEKVVKNTVKASREKDTTATETSATDEEFNASNYTFEVTEDTDTRDNSKIYLVKVAEKLSREEYLQMNKYIKSLGGYYSKFKHAFLFKDDPTEFLRAEKIENVTESAENTQEEQTEQPKAVSYTISEDEHTKTHQKIWVAKPMEKLNKNEFAKIKLKLATLKGFYSTFKQGFVFDYNPTEALQTG